LDLPIEGKYHRNLTDLSFVIPTSRYLEKFHPSFFGAACINPGVCPEEEIVGYHKFLIIRIIGNINSRNIVL
jgi:hypothetical protein